MSVCPSVPGYSPGFQAQLAEELEAMAGRFDAAFPLLEAALVEAPDDLDVRYLLAFCAFGRGDVRTAIIQAEAPYVGIRFIGEFEAPEWEVLPPDWQ